MKLTDTEKMHLVIALETAIESERQLIRRNSMSGLIDVQTKGQKEAQETSRELIREYTGLRRKLAGK